jgi:hypothetical protein
MVVITLIKSVIINHKNQDLDIIVVCQISLQNPVFCSSLIGRLIGVSLVLVGEDVIESSTRSLLALISVSWFRLYFRLHSHFDFIRFFLLSVAHFSSLPRYHRSYTQVSNSVCLSCVCVYSCIVSRTHFSSHRYLAIIAPTLSSHTTLSRFTCTRRYSLLVVTTKRQ